MVSPLATKSVDFGTKNSNPRTEKVSKITIHHMAGNMDAEACAKMHLRSSGASANYYVGTDGTICSGVVEERRAWTSSSPWNDQRAITIECANNSGAPNWTVSDKAYKAVIALCADICTRYGIYPHYDGSKEASLTLHCMFAATACPGPYLKGLHQNGTVERDIVAAMNDKPVPTPTPAADIPVVNWEKNIWDYLMGVIGNSYGVAGLMGNLYAESGLYPNNLQNSFEKRLGMNDAQYTAAVDNGSYTNFVKDGAGYGLAQWTFWSRKQNLLNYKGNKSISDLEMQLGFLVEELTKGYKGVLSGLKAAKTVKEASDLVLTKYEKPADMSDAVKKRRAGYGQAYYNRYGFKAYIARIIVPELPVRQEPSESSKLVQYVKKGSAYTIVDEQNGFGKLKSGVGWINLSGTQKVRNA